MALEYDKDLFELVFRPLAITEVSQLEVGKTYWSNIWEGPKVLWKVLSDREFDAHRGFISSHEDEGRASHWLIFEDGWYQSTWDANIGASYNAWLIFDNEEVAKECREDMPVRIYSDDEWIDDYIWDDPYLYDDQDEHM